MTSPTAATVAVSALSSIERDGAAGMETWAGSESVPIGLPCGSSPVGAARSSIAPLSTSAAVAV